MIENWPIELDLDQFWSSPGFDHDRFSDEV